MLITESNEKQPSQSFFRLSQIKHRLGVSRSTIWSWVKKGDFPAPVKLAQRTTAWHRSAIEEWEDAKINANK